MVTTEDIESLLEGWKCVSEGRLWDLAENFPTFEEAYECFMECEDKELSRNEWDFGLYYLLRRGVVGMDGFTYYWPEVAKENRRRTLEAMQKQSL